jgi:hypothetical protein
VPLAPCALQGRPIYIQLLGQVDVPAILKATDEDRLFKFHVQVGLCFIRDYEAL